MSKILYYSHLLLGADELGISSHRELTYFEKKTMTNPNRMLLAVALCFAVVSMMSHTGTATTPSNSLVNILQGGSTETFTETTPEPTTETPYDPFRFLILCAPGTDRRNTCEKCTKVTRDPKTYKMCCENNKGVRHWCRTFLDHTLPPRIIGMK